MLSWLQVFSAEHSEILFLTFSLAVWQCTPLLIFSPFPSAPFFSPSTSTIFPNLRVNIEQGLHMYFSPAESFILPQNIGIVDRLLTLLTSFSIPTLICSAV